MHLRDADAGGDLRLREAFLEAHGDDLALALGELVESAREQHAGVDLIEAPLLGRHVEAGGRAVVLAARQGERRARVLAVDRVEHGVGRDVEVLRELARWSGPRRARRSTGRSWR